MLGTSKHVFNGGLLSNVSTRQYSMKKINHPAFQNKQYMQTHFIKHKRILESTQEIFAHHSLKTKEMFKVLNLKTMFERPVVPIQMIDNRKRVLQKRATKREFKDFTKYSNGQWARKQRRKLITAMEQTDVYVDLFAKYVEHPEFKKLLTKTLDVNLVVKWDTPEFKEKDIVINAKLVRRANLKRMVNLTEENIHRSQALMGNYLPASTVQTKPTIRFDPSDKEKLYTLVMFTPDYPFRIMPDKGSMVHWLVTNIRSGQVEHGDEVISYLPPMPTEYAGTFRYVIALYEQKEAYDLSEALENDLLRTVIPKQEPSQDELNRTHELRSQIHKTAYAYEHEYIEQQIQQQLNFNIVYQDADNLPVAHSDYRPPKPENAITDVKELQQRRGLDLEKISNLALPSGLVFFRTEYEHCVSEVYEKNGWEEPFYVPPDEKHKNMLEEHKVYQGSILKNNRQLRNQWL
ncbi:hypothetical protein AKO1_001573 [Acrasis kona]|uniref:Uncharacterized protein n=1 Tax=Acrasis kona TaxID=1008807 RepID=A0AAW2ZA85_9EUKA